MRNGSRIWYAKLVSGTSESSNGKACSKAWLGDHKCIGLPMYSAIGASTANYTHHPNFPRLVTSSTGAEFLISGVGDPNFEFPISFFQVLISNMVISSV